MGAALALNGPITQQKEARQRIADGETQRSVARSYNVSQSTISRLPAGASATWPVRSAVSVASSRPG
jgi:transcriptional regulator with XRE-family HTH domain